MGTISLPYTFVAGQTPTATQWNSNPTTIATLVNGQIDKANVDSAGSDGIVTMDETQTISGAKTFSGAVINTGGITVKDVDNATGAVQTNLTLEWDPADGNNLTDNTSGIGIDFKMPDDADNQDVFASLNVMCVSDATTTENGEFSFKVMTDGTNSEVMTLQSTLGAAGTVLTLATAEPTVVDGDVLGRIDFQAPSEGSGTDAILVGASIYAEADDTFASGLNDTDLVFAVAESETAAERMRLSYDGTTVGLSFSGAATIDSGGNNALGLNAGTEDVVVTASNIEPASNDGSALGTSGTAWSDLFLADGGVINFNAGNLTVTHSAGVLTVNGNIAATDLDGIIGSNTAAAGTFTSIAGTTITGSGVLSIDDTTESTSTTTGSIHTDGGLGVAKDVVLGATSEMFFGDTANTFVTTGITINQQAATNEILSLKSTAVCHAFTDIVEDDTFGLLQRTINASGGVSLMGYTETINAIQLMARYTSGNQTKSASADSAIGLWAQKLTSNTAGAMGADDNILVVGDYSTGAKFIVDEDGDVLYDGSTSATHWDEHDDVGLLSAMRNLTSGKKAQHVFGEFIEENAKVLSDTGVITINDDGHHFVSTKGLNALIIDTIRQEAQLWRDKYTALESRLNLLEA